MLRESKTSAENGNPGECVYKLQIRKEELDIVKVLVQTGKVDIHKEIVQEVRNFSVSVAREELVIRKRFLEEEASGTVDLSSETIRIPIREERIEIVKRPVVLEDVSIYKQQIQGTKNVGGKLKREEVSIETTGDAKIMDKEI